MDRSELIKNLQDRLSSLLKIRCLPKPDRRGLNKKRVSIENAVISHNWVVSEEILHLDASSGKQPTQGF